LRRLPRLGLLSVMSVAPGAACSVVVGVAASTMLLIGRRDDFDCVLYKKYSPLNVGSRVTTPKPGLALGYVTWIPPV
jgi:hypothetical protein